MYNATVKRMDGDRLVSVSVAEVDDAGSILRGSAVQCTGLEGTPDYGIYLRGYFAEHQLVIVRDGCAGYKRFTATGSL